MHDNMCGMSTTHPVQCHNQTASYVQHHISCNESCSHIINLHSDPPPPSLLHPAHLCRGARPVTGSEKVCDGVRARSRITANAALPQTKGGAPALSEERMHAATHPRQAVTDSRFSFIGLLTYVCGGLWSTRGSISVSLFHRPVFAWPFDC